MRAQALGQVASDPSGGRKEIEQFTIRTRLAQALVRHAVGRLDHAAEALGPDAPSAVPALEEMARDPEVREAAEEALEAIRGHVEERPFEPAVPDLPPGAG